MLSAQVTGLASLGLAGIAGRSLATLVGVEMSASASAVAVGGDWLLVDVVNEGSTSGWEAGERDTEQDASTIGSRDTSNGTTESAALLGRKSSDVAGAGWAAADHGSRNDRGLSANGRCRSEESDD
jgi:hypothetical protein